MFVVFGCYFYLFIKNRIELFDGIIKVYKVGDYVVNFDVELIDLFKICIIMEKFCWIIFVVFSLDCFKLVLLDLISIWLFENF